jgi:hypothetical protein
MMLEELIERLREYDGWKQQAPAGWLPMDELDLMAQPVEYLLADGKRTRRPGTSNADWIESRLQPVAWRPVDAPPADMPDFDRLRRGIT